MCVYCNEPSLQPCEVDIVVISTTDYHTHHVINEVFSLKTHEVMKFSRLYAQNGGELDKEVTKRHTLDDMEESLSNTRVS